MDDIKKQIDRLIAESKLPHGMLFSGGAERHLSEFARGLASQILETENLEYHPDFVSVDSAKAEDVRRLLGALSLKAFGNRVVLINQVHDLTAQAASSLLKNIEEPSNSTYFIATTSHEDKVLPTIRSRVMIFRFGDRGTDISEAQEFISAKDNFSRLMLTKNLENIQSFLKSLYLSEISNFSARTSERLKLILRAFEYLQSNISSAKVLAWLSIKW